MTVGKFYKALDAKYPKALACGWDNDGMMVCPALDAPVRKVLVALDGTAAVLDYAAEHGFDVVLTHHPLLFRGLKSIAGTTVHGRHVLTAIQNGITVLSFHTRLDAAVGGVNDALCMALGYRAEGTFGDEEAPALGRLFTLPAPMTAVAFAALCKERLAAPMVRLNGEGARMVQKIAVCGGDGKDFIYPALAAGADLFLTGDVGYNMAGEAAEDGIITLEAGHYHTEAPVCGVLAEVAKELTEAYVEVMDSCTYRVL